MHCGSENPDNAVFCQECGTAINKDGPSKIKNSEKKKSSKGIKWTSVFFGFIVGLLIFILLNNNEIIYVLVPLMGGLIAAYLGGGEYKTGIKYGIITGAGLNIITGFFSEMASFSLYAIAPGISSQWFIASMLLGTLLVLALYAILGVIMGIIGGLIGIFVNNKFGAKIKI